jgi:hypothetical protein
VIGEITTDAAGDEILSNNTSAQFMALRLDAPANEQFARGGVLPELWRCPHRGCDARFELSVIRRRITYARRRDNISPKIPPVSPPTG